MTFAVLNVRPDQSGKLQLVRLLNRNIEIALEALQSRVVLCAPRDAEQHGYIGTALLSDLRPDCRDQRFIVAELDAVELFYHPIDLSAEGQPYESAALDEADNLAFYYYSTGVRALSQSEFDRIIAAAPLTPPDGMSEEQPDAADPVYEVRTIETSRQRLSRQQAIRDARLRISVLQHYGPVCAVSGSAHGIKETASYEVEVAHIRAVKWGGVDAVWNAMPMMQTLHWAYDHGLFSMSDSGKLLFSAGMQPPLRALFNGRTRASFPKDPRVWPHVDCLAYHRKEVFKG